MERVERARRLCATASGQIPGSLSYKGLSPLQQNLTSAFCALLRLFMAIAGQAADFQAAKPDLAMVVLQQDVALDFVAEVGGSLHLLWVTAALSTPLPHSYSGTFPPLRPCPPWCLLPPLRA